MNHLIIVGGGLIGMMTARQLAAAGMQITLLEKGTLGRESSWAGGGLLTPLYPWRYHNAITQLCAYGHSHYPAYCETLHDETGVDPEWTRSGMMVLSLEERNQAERWQQHYPVSMEMQVLNSSAELASVEPALSANYDDAIWLPDLAQLRNPRMLKSLKASILNNPRIDVVENTSVKDFMIDQHRVAGVLTQTSEKYKADAVVVCGGSWSAEFELFAKQSVKIEPVLGQMLLFKAKAGALQRIVLDDSGRYLIPRRDGSILCGSTLEFRGFEKHTTESARQDLAQSAYRIAPFLQDVPITHHWSGLRPGSPNGVPYIGQHPQIEGLYVNAGHYRNGIVAGLGSVRLLVDVILEQGSFTEKDDYQVLQERLPTSEFKNR